MKEEEEEARIRWNRLAREKHVLGLKKINTV
jgi:hypothetical protein